MKNINIKKYAFVLLVLGLVLVTLGTTYSIFTYFQTGITESSISVGNITFHYKEINGKGNGISIEGAYPISDEEGKNQSNYFDFRITSNSQFAEIPYVITAYAEGDIELANVVKLYLTEIDNSTESQLVLSKYTELTNATFTKKVEKVLYRDTVPVDGNSYEKNYRLRMWIDSEANFEQEQAKKYYCGEEEVIRGTICDNGRAAVTKHIQGSSYNGKSFSLRVNVYTNEGRSLTKENVTTPDDTRIKMLTANNTYLFNDSSDENIDLEVNLPNEVSSINLNTTLKNMKAAAKVIELGNDINSTNNEISTNEDYVLATGDNYFKLRITSADTTKTKDYILKVNREKEHDNNLTYLELEGYAFDEEFDKDRTTYSISVEEDSITLSANKASGAATIEGLGEKTLNWGKNNFTITVTAEDGTPKEYHIEVNNLKPEPPVLIGGTNGIESSLDQTITILSPGTAISGVAYYEYYKNTTGTQPTNETDGIRLDSPYELTVSDNGTSYIWYRTVSEKGNKSAWSDAEEININKIYDINLVGTNVTFNKNPETINYGTTKNLKITPTEGYYISEGSCTNGYTITNLVTDASIVGEQTITINNNNAIEGTTCTFTAQSATFTVTLENAKFTDNTTTKTIQSGESVTINAIVPTNYTESSYSGQTSCSSSSDVGNIKYKVKHEYSIEDWNIEDTTNNQITYTITNHDQLVKPNIKDTTSQVDKLECYREDAYYSSGYYYCSSGDSLSGTTCTHKVLVDQRTANYGCTVGVNLDGTCYTGLKTTFGQKNCANAGYYWVHSSCYTSISGTPTYNSCYYSDAILSGDTCYRYETSTYNAYYSSGYYYCYSGTQYGSYCYKTRTIN